MQYEKDETFVEGPLVLTDEQLARFQAGEHVFTFTTKHGQISEETMDRLFALADSEGLSVDTTLSILIDDYEDMNGPVKYPRSNWSEEAS